MTEERAGAKSVFHFDVPGSVAKSTHAGLPWLRFLRKKLGGKVHFWPFDGWNISAGKSAIVEVYPSLWSKSLPREERTQDQQDAYATAAWLRQADLDGIILLYRDATVAKLDHDNMCWRCPDIIVDHAQKLIGRNANRIDKDWNCTGKAGEYMPVQKLTQARAINYVLSEIERVRTADPKTSVLVLSPMGFCIEGLADGLDSRDLPYVDFWSSPIGEEDYVYVWWLRTIFTNRSVLNLLLLWKTLTPHYRKKLKGLLQTAFKEGFVQDDVLESIREMFNDTLEPYIGSPPTLSDFAKRHPSFDDLVARLDETDVAASVESLLTDINPAKEFDRTCVNVMSIHKSKGLQADVVFILGLVDGVLPNDSRGTDTIEAQRRLLFVGATRARKSLHLVSWVKWDSSVVHKVDKSKFVYRYTEKCYYGRTSRFIEEME